MKCGIDVDEAGVYGIAMGGLWLLYDWRAAVAVFVCGIILKYHTGRA